MSLRKTTGAADTQNCREQNGADTERLLLVVQAGEAIAYGPRW